MSTPDLHNIYLTSRWISIPFGWPQDPFTIFMAAVVIAITAFLYWLLFVPLNRIRDITHVGYGHLNDQAKGRQARVRDLANDLRKLRKVGQLPPMYPNGWFSLLESRDLNQGEVKPVSALGENFAVFRGYDNKVRILDAYCPHLGANLGVGGRVVDNCLECPFHGWQFRGDDGKCVHIPYAEKVPDFASVKTWKSVEANGFVFVWYHAEKEEPYWEVPRIAEIDRGDWVYRGRTEHFVGSHIQDIPENGGDIAHLAHLHKPAIMAGPDLRLVHTRLWEFAHHVWAASWTEEPAPNSHTAGVKLTHSMRFFSKIPLINMEVVAKQIGPALVHLYFDTWFGNGVLVQTVTPVAPLMNQIVHHFYTARSIPPPFSKLVLYGEAIMIERDIMIWNHKAYMSKPLLVKEDKLISRHRRWYSQFFSENSPRLTMQKDSLDW